MKNNLASCKFQVKKNGRQSDIFSYATLMTMCQLRNIESFEDLFNATNSTTRLDLLTDLKDKILDADIKDLEFASYDNIDGDHTFTKMVSATKFIEDFIVMSDHLQMATDPEAFKKWVIQTQINSEGLSQEEAQQLADTLVSNWEQIKEDGGDLHNVMQQLWHYLGSTDLAGFHNTLSRFLCRDGTNRLYQKFNPPSTNGNGEVINLFQKQLAKVNAYINSLKKQTGVKYNSYSGLHFSSDLNQKIQKECAKVGVHIDRLIVGDDGSVTVVNFKYTLSDPSTWSKNKLHKYDLEMAIIKQILKDNGILTDDNINRATFVNVPIILEYKDGYITNVRLLKNNVGVVSNVQNNVHSPLAKAEAEVKKFFNSPEVNLNQLDITEDLSTADIFLKALIPQYDATAKGLEVNAKSWIIENYKKLGNIKMEDGKWHVTLPNGEKYIANDVSTPTNNQEILKKVQDTLEDVNNEHNVVLSQLIDSIRNSYSLGKPNLEARGFKFNTKYIESTLAPYFRQYEDADGKMQYEWEFLTDPDGNGPLSNRGILLFKNKQTGQINTVVASTFRCRELIPLKYRTKGILGEHVSDMGTTSYLTATYGNMELMRTAAILNEILPKLQGKLGDIQIITPYNRGEGLSRPAHYVMNEYSKCCEFLNSNNLCSTKFKSNFKQDDFIDPVSIICQEYDWIANNKNSATVVNMGLDIDGLKQQSTVAGKVKKLTELIETIETNGDPRPGRDKSRKTPDEILSWLDSEDPARRRLANIYKEAVQYINYHTGFKVAQVAYISTAERQFLPQYANADENVRHISSLYSKALDRVAKRFQDSYGSIRPLIEQFYEDKGYGKVNSAVQGSAESLYQKFYKHADGKLVYQFINPYDTVESRELDATEKAFLKKALYHFNKVRAAAYNKQFNFTLADINSKEYQQYIETNKDSFFLVPLEKASKSHAHRVAIEQRIAKTKEAFERWRQIGTKKYLLELAEEKRKLEFDDGKTKRDDSIYDMSVANQMLASETDEMRAIMLAKNEDYETNIEYLLADYTEKQIAKEELEKVGTYGRCMLFQMHLLGSQEGSNARKLLMDSAKEIEDFMKQNLYGKSLLEDLSESFVQFLTPAKKLMTTLYIGANLRSAFRDSFEGLWQNMARTVSHFQTDLTAKSILEGYKEAIQNVFKSDRSLNICSELCLRYRLSNTDAAKISERAKTGRGGIFNPEEAMYSTLRGPDFLNRMTLFVARCKQDGVWDAFSMSEDGRLEYNWKKDARFRDFASGDPKSKAYKEAQSRYYTAIDTYNKEHGTNLSFDGNKDPLPEPYGQDDIRQFKMFADGIYGAYDKSQKAKYEMGALGFVLGSFSTWLNGHMAAYFRRPGRYDEYFTTTNKQGEQLIRVNDAGNEEYFDKHGNIVEKLSDGRFVNTETNEEVNPSECVPIVGKVPVPVQGIIYTIGESVRVLFESGFDTKEWKDRVWQYDVNQQNLNKLKYDALLWGIFAALFGFVLTPAYNDMKKRKSVDNVLETAMIELLYKSSYHSFDGFKGPVAIADYILNSVEPSAPNVSITAVKDLWSTVLGDKTFKQFAYGTLPIFRNFKDTAKMYYGGSLADKS